MNEVFHERERRPPVGNASKQTVVMTGGTSGFGRLALSHLEGPNRRIVIGARSSGTGEVTTLPLDLASLASVRQFADRVIGEIGHMPINALILNAGLHSTNPMARSADGYELTFATNHLGHYLLLRLLMPRLAEDAKVIVTTSGTHDPAERTGFPPPRHADARLLAHPEQDNGTDFSSPVTAGRAFYAASKLANVLTVRKLVRLVEEEGRGWTVLAFCPGQVPGTKLVRDYPVPMRLGWRLAGLFASVPFAAGLMGVNTAPVVAAALAGLAKGGMRAPPGRLYAAVRRGTVTWPDLSELARCDDIAEALWHESERLVGLSASDVNLRREA